MELCKGLCAKGRAEKMSGVIGIYDPYLPPSNPEISIDIKPAIKYSNIYGEMFIKRYYLGFIWSNNIYSFSFLIARLILQN